MCSATQLQMQATVRRLTRPTHKRKMTPVCCRTTAGASSSALRHSCRRGTRPGKRLVFLWGVAGAIGVQRPSSVSPPPKTRTRRHVRTSPKTPARAARPPLHANMVDLTLTSSTRPAVKPLPLNAFGRIPRTCLRRGLGASSGACAAAGLCCGCSVASSDEEANAVRLSFVLHVLQHNALRHGWNATTAKALVAQETVDPLHALARDVFV